MSGTIFEPDVDWGDDEQRVPERSLEDRRLVLIQEIQDIQGQLGARRTEGEDADYLVWRNKAIAAMRFKLGELTRLKVEIRAENVARGVPLTDGENGRLARIERKLDEVLARLARPASSRGRRLMALETDEYAIELEGHGPETIMVVVSPTSENAEGVMARVADEFFGSGEWRVLRSGFEGASRTFQVVWDGMIEGDYVD